ncbi:DMT family transporter [Virgibacillus sp. W0181]|uniref:DMT family transporter n=1 Tax=Virgibacillus sp. W0181 TaxID=3391581 RepID=UPI003F45D433
MNRAFILIIAGAGLWGTIGWFVKHLYMYGFTPMEVVTLRASSTAIILVTYLLLKSRKSLKLHSIFDLRYFIGTGIFSILFFNYCMFTAIELTTIPFTTALLYTAPAFVIIFSYFLFKEPVTREKVIALFLTILGICFIVGLIPWNFNALQPIGILFGLGSGIGYAFYSIFSKFALKKYTSIVITTYTFVAATVALLPFFPYKEKIYLLANSNVLFFAIGLGLFPTAIAYIIYTYGLQHTEASKASILSTIEPVVATIIGVFVFRETFTSVQLIGMVLILSAVIFVQLNSKGNKLEETTHVEIHMEE